VFMKIAQWYVRFPTAAGTCLSVLVASVIIGGCGGAGGGVDLVPVTGAVVQDGQPVAGADVMFMPQGAAPSSGRTGPDGRFELTFNDGRPGAVAGKHHVLITIPGPDTPPPTGEEEGPPVAAPTPEFHKDAQVQPSGENDFTFDIST
jgi:hypothetical protein